ncbi:MAG: flippase [Proteobacteria bacterium]|nr:flippase [Pseudomonadota bacterium]MBU1650513.1 flippase [Pseudomonadota bacterium]
MPKLILRKLQNLISDKKFSEILTGSAWALSANVVAAGLSMVTSIIVARAYGAEVLGIVAVLGSFLQLATIFTVLGTNTSILRLIPEHLTKYSSASAFQVYRKTQYFVAGVSVFTGTLLFFASGFIADTVFAKPHLRFYFALAAVFIVFMSLMELNTQAVRGLRLIRMFAFMRLLPSLFTLLILVPITIFFFHHNNPIYAMFASMVVTALVGAFIMDRAFKKKIGPNDIVHPMPLKNILAISLPMLMTSTMAFVIGQTGVIMLGIFRPEAEVGYYSVAVRMATLTTFVLSAINSMAAPQFSDLFQSDKIEELFYVAKKSSKLIFWTTTPILLFLILLGKPLLSLLFGSDFTVAYWAMFFLVLGQFVNSISGSTGYFMNMTGCQIVFRNVMFVAAFMNVILNLMLIPNLGIYGAALAGMFSLIFWNVYLLIYIKKKYGTTIGYLPLIC